MSMSNQPGTPRDDGEMGGNFLNPFQSESVSIFLTLLFGRHSVTSLIICVISIFLLDPNIIIRIC